MTAVPFLVWTTSQKHVREAQKECQDCMTNIEGIQPDSDILFPRAAGSESRDRPEGLTVKPCFHLLIISSIATRMGLLKENLIQKVICQPPEMNI